MLKIAIIGMGGCVGAILRYLVAGGVHTLAKTSYFPVGTMTVNITGCLLIGLLAGLAALMHTSALAFQTIFSTIPVIVIGLTVLTQFISQQAVSIVRMYAMYRPMRFFFFLGSIPLLFYLLRIFKNCRSQHLNMW